MTLMQSGNTDEYGVPVHTFEKSGHEQIRISINEYKGHEYIDIRQFYQTKDGLRPTAKGVTIRKDLFPDLLHGVVLLGEALGYDEESLTRMFSSDDLQNH